MASVLYSTVHSSTILLLLLLLYQNTSAKSLPLCKSSSGSPICDNLSSINMSSGEHCCLNCTLKFEMVKVILNGNGATITCTPGHGIKILRSPQVHIRDLTLENCGMKPPDKKSALIIDNCEDVSLINVIIRKSDGTGLSMLGSKNNVTIHESTFANNPIMNITGGRGVFIQHSGQSPAFYVISNSHFIKNNSTGISYLPSEEPKHRHGNGGGLYFLLKNASNVSVLVTNTNFKENFASRGAGLFLGLEDDCNSNTITILESVFDANHCVTQKIPKSLDSAGGGLAFLDHSHAHHMRNTFEIRKSNFTNNTAYYGGGLSAGMRAFHPFKDTSLNSKFTIENTSLSRNTARIGSAMDMFCRTISELSSLCTLEPTLRSLTITDNEGIYTYSNNIKGNTFSTVHLEMVKANFEGDSFVSDNNASGIGLDDAVMIIRANSSLALERNMATAGGGIAAIGSSEILLSPHTTLTIVGNSVADRGGGIYSAQTLDTYSLNVFHCFVKYSSESKSTLAHPDSWKADITVKNNTADGQPSSIFASSIYPCVWPSNSTNVTVDIRNTFCGWKSWKIDEDCEGSISTLPQSFTQTEYNVSVYPANETRIANFDVKDDLNHSIINSTVFSVCMSNGLDKKCAEKPAGTLMDINRGILTMEGEPDHYTLLVQTTGFRSVHTNLNVDLKECPVGYNVNIHSGGQCTCDNLETEVVNCFNNYSFLVLDVLIGHCIGNDSDHDIVVARCPYTICQETLTDPYIHNVLTKERVNEQFCHPYNRSGSLCSKCLYETDGINVFSPTYACIKCEHIYRDWILGISAALVPQVVFFAVVIIFHIGITAPSMNAYIFFSHVIVLPIQVLLIQIASKLDAHPGNHHQAKIMSGVVLAPYRLWTFDYPEIMELRACFGNNFKIMHALAFRYLQAFFPTILVLLTLALIELHARNCKPVVYLWRPLCYVCIRLRRKWELKTSVIDAFATVVLLSYSKIVNTSISLLTRNSVTPIGSNDTPVKVLLDLDTSTEYFKSDHVYFAITAIFVLCTFGLVPPLLLTLYPYKWFKKIISLTRCDKWHGLYAFVETFQGCYKDGTNGTPDRRWFAGIYFVFRIIIFLEFALINDLSSMFVKIAFTYVMFLLFFITVRPYKRDYYNYLDGAFLALLVSLNIFIYYLIVYAQQHKKLYHPLWRLTYALLLLPTLYLLLYTSYLTCTRSKCLKRHCLSRLGGFRQRSFRFLAETRLNRGFFQDDAFSILGGELVPSQSPLDNLSEVPDRIDHPDRYGDFDRSSRLGGTSYYKNETRRPEKEEREKLL